ncbi:Adenosine deaminase (editase) domain [Trypanosoma vivax]|nr:Adenosine deaminase (editase) domain [Trypanosoma vivax]
MMHLLHTNSLLADTPLEAFAAALRRLRGRDDWGRVAACAVAGEMSVVAGFVLQLPTLHSASCDSGGFVCVSLGSGTRCVGYEKPGLDGDVGLLVRDGHAEVMARRGFVAFLLDAANYLASDEAREHPFVQCCRYSEPESQGEVHTGAQWNSFCLRPGVVVHLVCTEYPCGAMSAHRSGAHVLLSTPSGRALPSEAWQEQTFSREGAYLPFEINRNEAKNSAADTTREVNFATCYGHKVAAHRIHPADVLPLVGRVKPGKGTQNLCMSCSDKLLRWHCLGVQGRRRSQLFPKRIHVSVVWLPHVAGEPGVSALALSPLVLAERALNDRRCYFFTNSPMPKCLRAGGYVKGEDDCQLPPSVCVRGFSSSLLSLSLDIFEGGGSESGEACKKYKKGDLSWSRSAWLTVVRGDASGIPCTWSMKRRREGIACMEAPFYLSWNNDASLILNTKAGIPRGVTRQHVSREVRRLINMRSNGSLLDAPLRVNVLDSLNPVISHFPLSRLWMVWQQRRVLRALSRRNSLVSNITRNSLDSTCSTERETFLPDRTFLRPVWLIDVMKSEEKVCFHTGGTVHYWLQESEQYRKNASSRLKQDMIIQSLPLLWVEKYGDHLISDEVLS